MEFSWTLKKKKKEKKTALRLKHSLKTHGIQTQWIPSISPPHDNICHRHTQPTSLWILTCEFVWIWFAFWHVLSRFVQPWLNQGNPTNQWIYIQLIKNSAFFFPQTACNCHPLCNLSYFESKGEHGSQRIEWQTSEISQNPARNQSEHCLWHRRFLMPHFHDKKNVQSWCHPKFSQCTCELCNYNNECRALHLFSDLASQ